MTDKVWIEIPESLFKEAERLAQDLNISPTQVFQMAIEQFIEQHQSQATPRIGEPELIVNQGDVYWLRLPNDTAAEIRHPYVVVQDNIFNHSRLDTVVVCALTSNLKRASYPANVLLEAHEANLPKPSVVEVSKVSSVAKTQFGDYIGSLSEDRMKQILAGLRFLHRLFFEA